MQYQNEYTNHISFPLGGIGTGSIGLSGTGRLIDWEIFGQPNKESYNGYSHFAMKVEKEGKVLDARVLNGDLPPHYVGNVKTHWLHSGYGFGPDQITMAGIPHFRNVTFNGEFPIANLKFEDETFISPVTLTAFNPFIPGDDRNSSLPAAIFEFEIQNPTEDTLDFTIALSVQNPTGLKGVKNRFVSTGNNSFLNMECSEFDTSSPHFGNVCIATDNITNNYQEYWYRGGWSDAIEMFWNDFTSPGTFNNRRYEKDFVSNQQLTYDVGTLAVTKQIAGGKSVSIRFVLCWYYPNMSKNWEHRYHPEKKLEDAAIWKHYYASLFNSSYDCAEYTLGNLEYLFDKTFCFKNALFSSSLPAEELDAIASNLSTLKSPTVLRLTDGEFYGFEGCISNSGCCEGSCQHVWNYAYALPFLFPDLERSMRDLEFQYSMREDGRMGFRLQLPLGTPPEDFRACVDGQMGAVIKAYREWKISGDTSWLKSRWPSIKKALEYAWAGTNEDLWDPDKTGVISGRQHHTLDMELFGPNSWLEGFYLCALKAGSEMAEALGYSEDADLYRQIFAKGKQWTDTHLFNGSYYHQLNDMGNEKLLVPFADQPCLFGDKTTDVYWNTEASEIKYQIGTGCMIDQVIGQWHANLCGLGEIFDTENTKSALQSIYKYNYHPSMREVTNLWRLYSINDEGGVMICTWPEGTKRPAIPLTYNSETMHGFEYQVAAHMVQMGLLGESHNIVTSIREKYDGHKRNPYNEFECGSNYARSMASYALLLAHSGFVYDMTQNMIGFLPVSPNIHTFWSIGKAWGTFEATDSKNVTLKILFGELHLKKFTCSLFKNNDVFLDDQKLRKTDDTTIALDLLLQENDTLYLSLKNKI